MYNNNIDNPLKVPIIIREIYNDIFEYRVEEPYYFESFGQSYGEAVYGGKELSNHYVIKKRKKIDGTVDKKLQL